MFAASELALFVFRAPNKRIIAFRSYIPENAVTNDEGIQVLDVPVQSSGGYLMGKTSTAESDTPFTNLPVGSYLFYWIREAVAGLTQLRFNVKYTGNPSNDIGLQNQPFTPGLYLVPIGNTDVFPAGTVDIQYTGAAYDSEVEFMVGALA